MLRRIAGFHEDENGDWVAELDCLHGQHVRHLPPFWERPWVESEAGRERRVGTELDCPLCDRAELPDGLVATRTAGPFDAVTVPPGLQRDHRVADSTWGLLRVLEGEVGFRLETVPPIETRLVTGQEQPIPPGVPHHVVIEGPVVLTVTFLSRPAWRTC